MRQWMVYYKDSAGHREGQAVIYAETREAAIAEYRMYYNVKDSVNAIIRIGGDDFNESR
tara:strand:+ start:117 stop:293 length:177 start_codon:yes stop_codon:yes gene_type:complete